MFGRNFECLLWRRRAKKLPQHIAHATRLPFTPDVECLVELIISRLDEMTEKPGKLIVMILVVSLFCFHDMLAKTLDPNIAIVQISQRGLQASRLGSERCDAFSPAFLE